MYSRIKNLLAFSFLFVSIKTVYAQNENPLDPITVTSSINPLNASQTGRNITVIKGEQLSKQPIQSFDDLLKYLPGIEVHQRGAFGSQADITMRGGTYQQVLVILDGIRLNDPLTGHFTAYVPIAPNEIDRIEILYGGSSAIYGTEAVGGVINVITKSFGSIKNRQNNFISAQAVIGEYGLNNTNIGGLYNTGKSNFGGGLNIINTNGQPQRGTNSFVNNVTGSLSFASKLNKNLSIAARGAYDNRSFSAQNFYTPYMSDTAVETVKTYWSHLQLNYENETSKLSFDAGYKSVNDSFKFNPAAGANINESSLFQSQLVYTRSFQKNNSLTVGGQFIQKNIASNDRGNHHVPQSAVFVIWQTKIGNNFFLNPAVRFDNSQGFGNSLVAQINAAYKLKKAQLRFNIGNTIRDADFTERYNNYGKTIVSSGQPIGNPDLQAEKSLNYELGADYFVNNSLKLTVSIFQRQQKDMIDFAPTAYANMPRKDNLNPLGNYSLASNISKLTTTGLELTVQYNKSWKNQNVFTTIGFLWLDNTDADALANKSFYILSQAKSVFNFNIQYSYKGFAIAANGIYKTRRQMQTQPDNYFIANAKVSYTLPKNHFTFFIQANNMFNKTYSDLLGTIMPQRWVSGGVQFKW